MQGSDRREFLRRLAQPVAAVAVVGALSPAWRSWQAGECGRETGCGVCPELGGCQREAALGWQQSQRRNQP